MLPILAPSSIKRIISQTLVIAKLNGRIDLALRGCVYMIFSTKQLPVKSDSNGIRTHNHLVRKRTLDLLAKLAN